MLQTELPAKLKPWLDVAGSLTARLKAACQGGKFNVRVLAERWERPTHEEAVRLGLPPAQLAWIRTVLLCCDHSPWVFARTVMPHSSLRGRHRRLRYLGTRALGSVVFAGRDVRRGPLELRQVGPDDRLLRQWDVPTGGRRLWARRSVLEVGGRPLLVMEVFLPELAYGVPYT